MSHCIATNLGLCPNGPHPRIEGILLPFVLVIFPELTQGSPRLARCRNELAWILRSKLLAWRKGIVSLSPLQRAHITDFAVLWRR